MEKTEVEQNIQKNIRKKRSVYRFKTEEERKTARREARKKYRPSAKGKEQLKREWEKREANEEEREKRRIRQRIYYKSEKGRAIMNSNSAKRKALMGSQNISNYYAKEIREIYRKCPKGCHVDHIYPLSKGGLHVPWNLQYLTAEENMRKGSKVINKDINKEF